MRYCGSKKRFMKDLKPILQEHLDSGESSVFVDAFGGGMNVICEIEAKKKVAIEYNKYVAALWNHLKTFGMDRLPQQLTEEQYYDVKRDYVDKGDKYFDW